MLPLDFSSMSSFAAATLFSSSGIAQFLFATLPSPAGKAPVQLGGPAGGSATSMMIIIPFS
jgi:hypothetical protein